MYLDKRTPLGLVTIGVGNLIDPVARALTLNYKWRRPSNVAPDETGISYKQGLDYGQIKDGDYDQTLAPTPDAVRQEWEFVKNKQDWKNHGAPIFNFYCKLMIDEAEITKIVRVNLNAHYERLKKTPEFASLDSWPADAQCGLLSLSWALGAGFAEEGRWGNLRAACAALDFDAAAIDCTIKSLPPDHPRNRATILCFRNGAIVQRYGNEPMWQISFWVENLYFPVALIDPMPVSQKARLGPNKALTTAFRFGRQPRKI